MKDYTNNNPIFSKKIRITEPTDPAHADNINAAPQQLLQNTLVNQNSVENLAEIVEKLLATGKTSVNLITTDGKLFTDVNGKVFQAAKRIQFR